MLKSNIHRLDKTLLSEIVAPGYINVSKHEIRSIVRKRRMVWAGEGVGTGSRKFQRATKSALASAELGKANLNKVRGLLIHMACDEQASIFEMNMEITRIQSFFPSKTKLKFGIRFNPAIKDRVQTSIIAAGIH